MILLFYNTLQNVETIPIYFSISTDNIETLLTY